MAIADILQEVGEFFSPHVDDMCQTNCLFGESVSGYPMFCHAIAAWLHRGNGPSTILKDPGKPSFIGNSFAIYS